jgi:hypothetical protein
MFPDAPGDIREICFIFKMLRCPSGTGTERGSPWRAGIGRSLLAMSDYRYLPQADPTTPAVDPTYQNSGWRYGTEGPYRHEAATTSSLTNWELPLAGSGETEYLPPPAPSIGRTRRGFGVAGALAAVVGGGMIAVSFTLLDWLAGGHSTFRDLHRVVAHHGALTWPTAYFGWLAWVALGVAVVVAVLACLPTPLHVVLRPLGVLVALAGVAATLFAIEQLPGGTWHRLYYNAIVGVWCAVAGFGLAGLGALMGPRRVLGRRR